MGRMASIGFKTHPQKVTIFKNIPFFRTNMIEVSLENAKTIAKWIATFFITVAPLLIWFIKRKIQQNEHFEQIIDKHRAFFPDEANDKYTSFAINFVIRYTSAAERAQYLHDHKISETRKFYKWLDKKQKSVKLSTLSEMK